MKLDILMSFESIFFNIVCYFYLCQYFNDNFLYVKIFMLFQKTSLYIAVQKQNIEIVRLLLERNDLDVNAKSILNL